MYTKEFYAWRNEKAKVDHFDKVVFIIVSDLTLQSVYEDRRHKYYEQKFDKIEALLGTLHNYCEKKLGKSFRDIECKEVTWDFVIGYKEFLNYVPKEELRYGKTALYNTLRFIIDQADILGIADLPDELYFYD